MSLEGQGETIWHRHNLDDYAKFWLGAPEYYRENEYFLSKVAAKSGAEPSFSTALKVDSLIAAVQRRAHNLD